MKRSIQEIVELVVFGLIAVIVGTGLLWLVGWLIGLLGGLFKWVAGILWLLLTYVIPVVVIIAAIFFLFRLLQNRNRGGGSDAKPAPVVSGPPNTGTASSGTTGSGTSDAQPMPAAAPVTTPQVQGLPYSSEGAGVSPVYDETVTNEAARNDVEIVDPEPVEGHDEDGSRRA